jgi:hypothetical protein
VGGAAAPTTSPANGDDGVSIATTAGSGGADEGSGVTDPCALLTPAEISAEYGREVEPGVLDSDMDPPQCTWNGIESGGLLAVVASIKPYNEDDWSFYLEMSTPEAPTEELTGIGDGALRLGGILEGIIAIRVGDRVVEMAAHGQSGDDLDTIGENLARLIAARL